jgi:hypothetical protein
MGLPWPGLALACLKMALFWLEMVPFACAMACFRLFWGVNGVKWPYFGWFWSHGQDSCRVDSNEIDIKYNNNIN